MLSHLACDPDYALASGTELYPTLFDIRTRDIQFNHIHTCVIQLLYRGTVVLRRIARHVGDNFRPLPGKPRQIIFDKVIYPRILQPYGIEHSAWGLRHSWRRI